MHYSTFITPSVSPIYNNNPSFTLLELDKLKVKEAISYSFDLTAYTLYQAKSWTTINWQEEFGIDFNDGGTIKTLY